MPGPVKVFVSYSWSTEKETNIVDDLDKLCPQRGLTLIRDNKTLKHGDLIEAFMKELSKGDHVITLFSKPYFQSKWCMYELLNIFRGGDFQQRTHPVIADECDLQDEDYRLQVVDYWREQFETTQDKLKKYDPLIVQDEHNRVKLYRDIYQNIDELLNFAAGRVTTPLAELQQQKYEQLLADLSPINPSNQESKNHTSHQHHLPVQPDNEFIAYIKEQIAGELNAAELNLFRDVLKQELDKSLEKLELPKIADNQAGPVVDGLIDLLKAGKSDVPVITTALNNAAMHCFNKKGRHYQATLAKHEHIKEAIQQILGWMVLASVDDGYIRNLGSAPDYPSVYFELPVETPAGVELIVSRRYQRQAKFKSDGSTITGLNHLCVSSGLFSWKASETVETLKRLLWNQVFPDEKKEINLSLKETTRLNAELEIRRADEWAGEHHLIAIECEKIDPNEAQGEVYRQLLNELNNLTLVHFGVSGNKQVFYAPEHHLMSAINRFLNNINHTLNS